MRFRMLAPLVFMVALTACAAKAQVRTEVDVPLLDPPPPPPRIVVTYPDTARTVRALRSLDFLAVATQMLTPTAELADLVLPKTTTLEEEEVALSPAGPCVVYTRAVARPRDIVPPAQTASRPSGDRSRDARQSGSSRIWRTTRPVAASMTLTTTRLLATSKRPSRVVRSASM